MFLMKNRFSVGIHYMSSLIPRGEGGTLIFSHVRRLRLFLGVQNSEFQYILGISEK